MGILGPLMSQGLGRSPYDDVIQGEGPENPRGPQQLYDDRGRPINPETKRINRDVIRSHNEVMMVIGVAEPENGIAEAQLEAAYEHREYEDRVGRRLLVTGGWLGTAASWGVNGLRQRILLYKPYSQTTFYGMFQLAWSQQSLGSYLFSGLPSFMASALLEQLTVLDHSRSSMFQYATTYIRLHLAIYTVFQRTGIIPSSLLLPNWRFFIPGSNMSPIIAPPAPTSLHPRSLLTWLGGLALGAAPFAGFYLYTKFYGLVTRTLRFRIHQRLPRPTNTNRRRRLREGTFTPPVSGLVAMEARADSPTEPASTTPTATTNPSTTAPPRRQSTNSLQGNDTGSHTPTHPVPNPTPNQDDFASDDEETEIISATLISFDVEATDVSQPDPSNPNNNSDNVAGGGDTTPGIWSAELRPNIVESGGPNNSNSSTLDGNNNSSSTTGNRGYEPTYRESVLTRLPAILATDVLAITPARLLMTPLASLLWLGLAKPYMARAGMSLEGVVDGVGWWWGLSSGRALVNLLGLELLLAGMQGEIWAGLMMAAEAFRFSEEEWNEKEGVAGEVAEGAGEE